MAKMVGPLPVVGWAILGGAGVLIWLAGKDLNRTSVIIQNYPGAYNGYRPFDLFRFGRPNRHLKPPQTPEEPVPPGSGDTPQDFPNVPTMVPTTDSAAPPYFDFVNSTLVPQAGPNINYITVGDSDSLYTMASRLYNNPMRSVDIFNANRQGVVRADGTPGIMASPDFVQPGTRLIIP